ncbi:ubiquitin-associated protein 2 isoform X8 [Rattus norvegicus]|nr:ubiquitin-associated protein 2 [Rattus norvegicus]XP_038965770.1 ubiquitin-associated protein 2 isoform X3 [Rattus norvegicus]XP_038965771.1 ubiquitin-associated protein 2 isoform X3 [Rattus norvegicus]|eukprot:XP_006238114.1 PREDICTED: ubiquitin-associated protein 2 isoform X2 [Rattus norvegicus]
MMTSVSNDRCRGAREKPQMPTTHAAQSQKQVVQATAEQMRLAQVIFDKNDSDFEAKVKQLMEVTGKNQDECIVALHDCNGDVNKAINTLLEGSSDTTSWETVGGKKKNFGRESSENKENREKRTEREASRGRGNNNRKGRGGSRGREFKGEENGVDCSQGDKPSERGKRTRGRGFGRGRGRGAGRLSAQSMGTFNPADYSESMSTDGCGTKLVVWEAAQNGTDEGPEGLAKPHSISQELPSKSSYGLKGAWKNSVEEWTAEDWTEDLSETKVFTASSAPADNHVPPGQSIDLVALLHKPAPPTQAAEVNSFETSQQQGFGQALVFTNSQHNNPTAPGTASSTPASSYSPQSLSSVLGSGFGELAQSKMVNISNSQILDKLKPPGLSPFPAASSTQQNDNASPPATTAAWDLKPSAPQPSVLSHLDFKSQPEPSPVLSQLSQRQQQQNQAVSVPPPGLESFPSQTKHRESAPGDGPSTVNRLLQLPTMAVENIVSAHQPQPKHIKLPKRRIPPASKVPVSAVEMPGSADITGLNVQFGALEFGSEPSLSEFGSTASASENSSQLPISLYPKSLSEPLNASFPMTSAVQNPTYTTSVITSSTLTSSSVSSTSPVTTCSSYDQSSVHTRIAYQSPASPADAAPGSVANGHGGGRSQHTVDTTSSVPAPKKTDPSALPSVSSLPSPSSCTALLPPSSQHTATLPALTPGELSSSPLSQLSSSLSSHQSSLSSTHATRSTSTPHTHASVESTPSSAAFSAATSAPSAPSSGVALPGSMSTVSSLCLGGTTVSAPSSSTRATALVTSGKAPPNLPQGVPPLLHNQYLVGPGGLLPAYPIYGYDELQMLQSRLPMDYYGIPFAAPTALASRDGNLANNPYSGDVTKFGRGDSASPAPPTTPAQAQQSQSQTHHTAQQPFLNPALPPGYSYTGLPYYTGVPGAFQYGPTMFVPPTSAKQHGVTLSTPPTPFQQASGYGQHAYSAGYDDLTQGTAAGDYTKGGYGGSSQAPNKSAGSGPSKGVSVSSGTGLPDMTGSVYNKTQTFDKQGFHTGTPPPFSLPSALGSTGPLAPGAAPGYAPAPFLHIMPAHQQPHSQLLHHHLPQDAPSGSGQRSQPSSLQPKSQASKPTYGNSPYWTN